MSRREGLRQQVMTSSTSTIISTLATTMKMAAVEQIAQMDRKKDVRARMTVKSMGRRSKTAKGKKVMKGERAENIRKGSVPGAERRRQSEQGLSLRWFKSMCLHI